MLLHCYTVLVSTDVMYKTDHSVTGGNTGVRVTRLDTIQVCCFGGITCRRANELLFVFGAQYTLGVVVVNDYPRRGGQTFHLTCASAVIRSQSKT